MSKVPTEPGWYWCKPASGTWCVVRVYLSGNELYAGARGQVKALTGTWGDKIPEPVEPLPLPRRFRCWHEKYGDGVGCFVGAVVQRPYRVFYSKHVTSYASEKDAVACGGYVITEWIDEE